MDKKAFGKRMQKYREQAGYSQESLAEKIECSAIFISCNRQIAGTFQK